MKLDNPILIISYLIIAGMLIFIFTAFVRQAPAGDEMVFIRLTDNLPEYKPEIGWFSLDGITDPNNDDVIDPFTGRDDNEFYEMVYAAPIWHHPFYANCLAYPFVKSMYSEGTNDEITTNNKSLRVIAWMMISFCILSVAYLIRKKTKNDLILLLSLIPMVAMYILFTHWGNNWFYYDTFMLVALCVALLMRHTKYEKYIYIPLFLMVGCKGVGFLFLLPFAIENRKTLWCLTAWIPFLIYVFFITGDWLYLPKHWLEIRQIVGSSMEGSSFWQVVSSHLSLVFKGIKSVWLFSLVMVVPFIGGVYYALKRRLSWFYVILFAMACIEGLCFSMAHYQYYQMTPMMVSGVLLTAFVVLAYRGNRG